MRAKDALGRYGEEVAARHLVESGLAILDRNWRCGFGEIDIVAREGDVLVVCEVKTRSGVAFGTPASAVTAAKARRLRRLAACWLGGRSFRALGAVELRFDVIGVLQTGRGVAQVEHLRGAL